ncbi:hypothetical protein DTO212C5_2237 [Paecilomyces variotii]|nr:hypothetical protein DTO212C5_2237 [Paecilomyces variotii]
MPKAPKFDESRMLEACAAAQALEKPNITKVAREYGVPMRTLRNRVLNITRARTERIPVNKTLETHQEKALMQRVADLRELNMPVTSQMIVEWANQALARSGKPDKQVSKMWVYRFMKRLEKNQEKLLEDTGPVTPEMRRQLERLFEYNRIASEQLAMANDMITRILNGRA